MSKLFFYDDDKIITSSQFVTIQKPTIDVILDDDYDFTQHVQAMYKTCTINDIECTPIYSHHTVLEDESTTVIVLLTVKFTRKIPTFDFSKAVKAKDGSYMLEIDLEDM